MAGVIRHVGTTVACRELSCMHATCRLMFFEQAREQAESDFKTNPRAQVRDILNSKRSSGSTQVAAGHAGKVSCSCCRLQALTRWGGALLELAHFRQGDDSYSMIEDVGSRTSLSLSTACNVVHAGIMRPTCSVHSC
jgi:Plant specific mitochondrial import receptor subunit TOM20